MGNRASNVSCHWQIVHSRVCVIGDTSREPCCGISRFYADKLHCKQGVSWRPDVLTGLQLSMFSLCTIRSYAERIEKVSSIHGKRIVVLHRFESKIFRGMRHSIFPEAWWVSMSFWGFLHSIETSRELIFSYQLQSECLQLDINFISHLSMKRRGARHTIVCDFPKACRFAASALIVLCAPVFHDKSVFDVFSFCVCVDNFRTRNSGHKDMDSSGDSRGRSGGGVILYLFHC